MSLVPSILGDPEEEPTIGIGPTAVFCYAAPGCFDFHANWITVI